jgi:hypothetical protein
VAPATSAPETRRDGERSFQGIRIRARRLQPLPEEGDQGGGAPRAPVASMVATAPFRGRWVFLSNQGSAISFLLQARLTLVKPSHEADYYQAMHAHQNTTIT